MGIWRGKLSHSDAFFRGVIGSIPTKEQTVVTINMLAAHRSPKNFTNPYGYHPERWLGDPAYASDNRDVFHPFSLGPRSCIGRK